MFSVSLQMCSEARFPQPRPELNAQGGEERSGAAERRALRRYDLNVSSFGVRKADT